MRVLLGNVATVPTFPVARFNDVSVQLFIINADNNKDKGAE